MQKLLFLHFLLWLTLCVGGWTSASFASGVVSRKTSTKTSIRYTQGHKIKTTLETTIVTHRFAGPKVGQDTLKIVTYQRRIIEHTYPDGRTQRTVQKRSFTNTRLVKAQARPTGKTRTTNLWGAQPRRKVRWFRPQKQALRRRFQVPRPAPPQPPQKPTAAGGGSQWRQAWYRTFTHKTFSQWTPAQQTMVWGQVDLPLLQAAVFFETNRQRARFGRAPLGFARLLEKAAVLHSRDMVRLKFFSHNSPIRRKKTPSARVFMLRPMRWGVGENIAISFAIRYRSGSRVGIRNGRLISPVTRKPIPSHTYLSAAKAVVQQWMGSPGHRENILSKTYTLLGIGVAPFKRGLFPSFKWTQMFGHPY